MNSLPREAKYGPKYDGKSKFIPRSIVGSLKNFHKGEEWQRKKAYLAKAAEETEYSPLKQ